MKQQPLHTFHIPVMGLAYTIDSPIRVAHLGISSVLSVMDDELIERMNQWYSAVFELPYQQITTKMDDFRALRITNYLNTVDTIVKKKFERFKNQLIESRNALENFVEHLPSFSNVRNELQEYLNGTTELDRLQQTLDTHLSPGSIDVNIMTKVDREHYKNQELLPSFYNDAHAALRGFAHSTVRGSVVLSAGMNPKLFSYFETFDCFFPNEDGVLDKKIILKVSDFRSALIQGQQLAKRGLWVSEYRIESGFNCGGHAFVTEGQLMGPILQEFKDKREELIQTTHALLQNCLESKGRYAPKKALPLFITAQGGIGTAEEHYFLLDHYHLDRVGWGSPFLLVPEATSSDEATRQLLASATEKDLYLSNISPLGVPFNTVRGTTNEYLKEGRIKKNDPGSSCPRKYLALNTAFDKEGTCTASRKHQKWELAQLKEKEHLLTSEDYEKELERITEKSCLCIGLANASLMEMNLPIKGQDQGVVVCPGPNIAYFNSIVSLKEMVQHIYGTGKNLITKDRPSFFIKELQMYVDHYKKEKEECELQGNRSKQKKLDKLRSHLIQGIAYYHNLLNETTYFNERKAENIFSLDHIKKQLEH